LSETILTESEKKTADQIAYLGTVENHGKNGKNTAHFCENRKNHGEIMAAYVADNLAKN